ncbi:hypothetical protein EON67_11640 [archaeon]|nr:MAG: hypothetical protein EON67_11640 [archaeon]
MRALPVQLGLKSGAYYALYEEVEGKLMLIDEALTLVKVFAKWEQDDPEGTRTTVRSGGRQHTLPHHALTPRAHATRSRHALTPRPHASGAVCRS